MSDHSTGPLVLALDDPTADLERVGGRGASLARLGAAGLPVPGGFHVTAEAYRRFVTVDGLQDAILAALVGDTPAEFRLTADRIGELFAQREVPEDTVDAIRSAYAAMSATAPGGRGAVLRDRRGSARHVVRRPVGDLPQRVRRCGAGESRPAVLGIAVDSTGHRLPDPQQRRPGLGGVGRGQRSLLSDIASRRTGDCAALPFG
ncbi:MAG: PEP/pyruvate-binding domain-containing protein [Pseudonocardiaceae bacterium]